MKNKNNCVYKNVCQGSCQKCRSCQLKFAPYDKNIALQLQRDNARSKHKYGDERDLLTLDRLTEKYN